MLYDLILTMPEKRLLPLMTCFAEMVAKCRAFSGVFEVIYNEGMDEAYESIKIPAVWQQPSYSFFRPYLITWASTMERPAEIRQIVKNRAITRKLR